MASIFLQDPILPAVALGTGLPFLAMALILIFTRHNPRLSSRISIGAISVAVVSAVYLLVKLHAATAPIQYQTAWLL